MRGVRLLLLLSLTVAAAVAQAPPPLPYSIPQGGALSQIATGDPARVAIVSARIEPAAAGVTPNGMAIFGYRQGGVLISETTVSARLPIQAGRIDAEVSPGARTGLALANPGNATMTVDFYFTDGAGRDFGNGAITLSPYGQLAAFLDERPFRAPPEFSGTLTFAATAPVAAVALRGILNARAEFLMTAMPVADLASSTRGMLYVPHVADGGGWTTEIALINPTESILRGQVAFYDTSGAPMLLTMGAQGASAFLYSLPPHGAGRLRTAGSTTTPRSGSVRIVPDASGVAPVAAAIYSYAPAGTVTALTAAEAVTAAIALRLYGEASGNALQAEAGSIRTAIAVLNLAPVEALVSFETNRPAGGAIAGTGAVRVPAQGQVALFLDQIAGLDSLALPFSGAVRIRTSRPEGIAVLGLRARHNERRDFLITATPVFAETAVGDSTPRLLPHLAIGGGYSTQLIVLGGATEASTGAIRFFSPGGQAVTVAFAPGVTNPPLPNPPPAGEQYGPWNRDLEIWESSDGLRFTRRGIFVERGGVPALARTADGTLLAVFQWFPLDRRESFDQIAVMTSLDDGQTWTAPRTISIRGMPGTLNRSFDPTSVVLADGRLRLYFSSERGTPQNPRGNRAIFSAISADGLVYDFEPGERFGLENAETFDTAVARLGDTWHLYCPIPAQTGRGYHATSPDGLAFTRQQDVLAPGQRDWLGNVIAVNDGLRFYGSGRQGWTAFSSDGFNWLADESANPPGGDPGIVVTRSGLWLAVSTGPLRPDAAPGPAPF